MTRSAALIAELEAINRERPLTDAETRKLARVERDERYLETWKRRYATDPEFRAKVLGRARGRKFRYAADPDYRQRQIERVRAYREARA